MKGVGVADKVETASQDRLYTLNVLRATPISELLEILVVTADETFCSY